MKVKVRKRRSPAPIAAEQASQKKFANECVLNVERLHQIKKINDKIRETKAILRSCF